PRGSLAGPFVAAVPAKVIADLSGDCCTASPSREKRPAPKRNPRTAPARSPTPKRTAAFTRELAGGKLGSFIASFFASADDAGRCRPCPALKLTRGNTLRPRGGSLPFQLPEQLTEGLHHLDRGIDFEVAGFGAPGFVTAPLMLLRGREI